MMLIYNGILFGVVLFHRFFQSSSFDSDELGYTIKCYENDETCYLYPFDEDPYRVCKKIKTCEWNTWGEWSFKLFDEECGRETRTRTVNRQYEYPDMIYTCRGVKRECMGDLTKDTQERIKCRCKEIITCQWNSWGRWSSSIADGSCGKETRIRTVDRRFRFTEQENNCNGFNKDCLTSLTKDEQQRTKCKCKQTSSCKSTDWSAWKPSLEAGKCVKQSSTRDFVATYNIIQQLSNCNGIDFTCSGTKNRHQTLCSCPYADCTLPETWSAWYDHGKFNTDNCPIEERSKKYPQTKIFKKAFNTCDDVGPTECPKSPTEERDKVILCPGIPVPNGGKLEGGSCNSSEVYCGVICQLKCNDGYELKGNSATTCSKNGEWDVKLGTCEDRMPPKVKCPLVSYYETISSENHADIILPLAIATDNSGITPTITVDQPLIVRVEVFKPLPVVYRATDKAGNVYSCRIILTVIDTEPPKVITCPNDVTVTPSVFPHPVMWPEAKFLDNVDHFRVKKYPSHYSGQDFTEGSHIVRITAKDSSSNNASCEFKVQVSKAKCQTHDPPIHGSKSCNVQRSGKNETFVCSVRCHPGYHFLESPGDIKVYDFYVCGEKGNWRGQNKFDPMKRVFFVPIPRKQRPWSECARLKNAVDTVSSIRIGCLAESEMKLTKKELVDSLKADPMLSQIYCRGDNNNCVVSNVIVTCVANKIKIEFQPQNIILDLIDDEVENLLQSFMKRKNEERVRQEKCDSGSILLSSNSSISKKEQCLVCPVGTYHDVTKNECTRCPIGQYQSDDGQTNCIQCPSKHSTVLTGSKNVTDCKAICYPGSFSPTGVSTCFACKLNFYQPKYRQKSCIACPNNKKTKEMGRAALSDCE